MFRVAYFLFYCIVLYSFIVQVDRTQLILHTSRPSFAYTVHLYPNPIIPVVNMSALSSENPGYAYVAF